MYVYIQYDIGLFTVGFYSPDGQWHPESNHENKEAAAKRVSWLNGREGSVNPPMRYHVYNDIPYTIITNNNDKTL